jgi:hypothetical protein
MPVVFFSFPFFPLSLVLWSIYWKQEPWSRLTKWLYFEQYFVPSFHRVGCNLGLS